MAIIKCPECNKEFSDKALACPSCGFPTSKITGNQTNNPIVIDSPNLKRNHKYLKIIIPVLSLLIITVAIIYFLFFVIQDIKINEHEITIGVGDEISVNYTIQPERTINKSVKWSSSDDSIASVKNGVIHGKSEGSCIITVETKDGHYDNCSVTVKSQKDIQSDLVNNLCEYIIKNSDANSENTYMMTVAEHDGNQFILCYGKERLCLIYNVPSDFGEQMTCVFIEAGNLDEAIVTQINTLKIDGQVMRTTGKGTIQLKLYTLGDTVPIWNIEAENAPNDAEIGMTDEFQKVVDDGVKEAVSGFKDFLKENEQFGTISQYGFTF